MKLKIKVKVFETACTPDILVQGDWIDLRSAININLESPVSLPARNTADRKVVFKDFKLPLGVAMQLPKGYEAVVNPRSSTYKKYGILLTNSQGVIDNSYCGDSDQWYAHIVALRNTNIHKGDRLFQFRIQLSQKATLWQRFKNLFVSGVKLKYVTKLNNPDRGGYGSTDDIN